MKRYGYHRTSTREQHLDGDYKCRIMQVVDQIAKGKQSA